MASLGLSRYLVLLVINILYLILGCVLDPASIVILTVPVVFPIVVALGFDPIWFGVIVTLWISGKAFPPICKR